MIRTFLIFFALISVSLYEADFRELRGQVKKEQLRTLQVELQSEERAEQRVLTVLQEIDFRAQKKNLIWETRDAPKEVVRLEPVNRKRRV